MGYKNAIKYIIPHFDQYPQLTKKHKDYLLWKEIIFLQNNQEHLTLNGFIKCLSLKANLNKGLNNKLKVLFPNIIPLSKLNFISKIYPNKKVQQKEINFFWFSGFVAGDGSFLISKRKNQNCKIGFQVTAIFNIAQHNKDLDLIKKINLDLFENEGQFYNYKSDCRIVFSNLIKINKYIIPHFKKYPLMNRKELEFMIWCQIIKMIEKKEHLTIEGLNKIHQQQIEMRQVKY